MKNEVKKEILSTPKPKKKVPNNYMPYDMGAGIYETDDNGLIVRAIPKTGRNAPCPCGSGKKYKKCCGGINA